MKMAICSFTKTLQICISCFFTLATLSLVLKDFPSEELTVSEMKAWYTELELNCMSENVVSSHCQSLREDFGLLHDCNAPYETRSYFNKSVKGYSKHPENHSILKLIPTLFESAHNNVTIIWIGDSITIQRVSFMIFDMKRYLDNDGKLYITSVHKPEEQVEDGNNHKITVSHDKYPNSRIAMRHVHLTTNEFETGHGYHRLANSIIDRVNYIEKTNALIIISMGAWFSDRETFRDQVHNELIWLKRVVQRPDAHNEALWLTAWPIHNKNDKGNCMPFEAGTDYDWKNDVIFNLFQANDQFSPHIHLFSDKIIMDEMFDMHTGSNDCVHYCYAPLPHQPLWDAIGIMLEKFQPRSTFSPQYASIFDSSHTNKKYLRS